MNTFTTDIFGTQPVGHFFAAFLFAIIGVVISLLIHSTNRDKESPTSPYKFNFGYLIKDNIQRIILNLILIVITIRFYPDIKNEPLTMLGSLTVGLTYDKLAEFLRNKNVLDTGK